MLFWIMLQGDATALRFGHEKIVGASLAKSIMFRPLAEWTLAETKRLGVRHGDRWIDDDQEQPRTKGHDGPARGPGESKRHERVRPHRSRRRRHLGRTIAAPDGGLDLRQSQGRHAADAGSADHR